MIQTVIFDMDGTIFDTERLLLRSWQEAVERGAAPPRVLDEIPKWRGHTRSEVREMLEALFEEAFSVDGCMQLRAEIIREILDREGVPLKEGVPQVFEELKEMGISMALATASSAASVEDYMRRTGYKQYFDRIITGDCVSNGKPAPDLFLLAAEEVGVSPDKCVVVEDSPNGVRAGVAAGMKVIMVPDLDQPDAQVRRLLWHCCETLSEIPLLIKTENENA